MNVQFATLRCVIVAALAIAPRSVHAECFTLTGKFVMSESAFELVFSGRVSEIARKTEAGYRATFDVDRVWKGSVPRRIDLYVWELSPEVPRFEVGHHYVALAQKLTDSRTRQGVGLAPSDTVAFAPVQCSNSLAVGIEGELGTGRPPK